MTRLFIICLLLVPGSSVFSQIRPSDIVAPQDRPAVIKALTDLCDWSIAVGLRTGQLQVKDKRRTSVFINSNLGRMLLAAYELVDNPAYKEEALLWFDRLAALQQTTLSTHGDTAGYWGDVSPQGNIYLGDAGTAATALAGAVRFTSGARKASYLNALKRYAVFVQYGCKEDPQGKGRGGSPGWIVTEGEDKGAIGCGYYRQKLAVLPYTISSSVTGAAFFSSLYVLTERREYLEIAENAVRWLLKQRDAQGEYPYLLQGEYSPHWPFDTMSYVSDGLVGLYVRTADEELKKQIRRSAGFSVQWLLNRQNDKGVWGRLRSEDQQRSQGSLHLLVWYYDQVLAEERLLDRIRENYRFFLNPRQSARYGIMDLPIPSGFAGLALAEALQPGITYRLR